MKVRNIIAIALAFVIVSIFIVVQTLKIVFLQKELDKHWVVITQQQKELSQFRAIATPKSKVEMLLRQIEKAKKAKEQE